jgi:hypothetical protein
MVPLFPYPEESGTVFPETSSKCQRPTREVSCARAGRVEQARKEKARIETKTAENRKPNLILEFILFAPF